MAIVPQRICFVWVCVCQHLAQVVELSCLLLADDSAVEALDGAVADVWFEVQQACFLCITK